jgi:hypothetical protein
MQIRHFVSVAVGLMCLVVVAVNAQADPIVVNCDQGQSLRKAFETILFFSVEGLGRCDPASTERSSIVRLHWRLA